MSQSTRRQAESVGIVLPVRGAFTTSIESFFVEELPLYEPCGEGEHLYVGIEKRGLTTRQVVRRACELFGVSDKSVGYAGLKDKHATTRQVISIHGATEAGALSGEGVEVLWERMHRNKLRVGHLNGNRFRARIDSADASGLETELQPLVEHGLPNLYGDQRFGRNFENVERGLDVLRRGPRRAGSRWKAKLLISALQSRLFNSYLERRLDDDTWLKVQHGDLLRKEDSGGSFICDDPATDQARHDGWALSVTGPMFGPRMTSSPPDSHPGQWEREALDTLSLTLEDFKRLGKLGPGSRRPLRAQVSNASVNIEGEDVCLAFDLPPGTYATVLIDRMLGN